MGIFNSFYDNQMLTKYTVAFGTLFKDMVLVRKNPNNTEFERYTIPLSYAPKEKFIQRTLADPSLERKENITLPRMAFEMVGLSYDSQRNLNNKFIVGVLDQTDPNHKTSFYSPAPYNITFELYIITKTITEMLQIVEQILPAFRPDYTIAIKPHDAPMSNKSLDVPITLLSESSQDNYDGSIAEDRQIIWTLQFMVKGYLFGPIKKSPIIKQVIFTKHDISQIDAVTPEVIQTATFTVVVEGKTLEEIYETDNWSIEEIFT